MSDRMLVSLFVTVLAIIGMFFLFDLCIDDESEPGDLGMAAWVYRSEPPPGDGPGRDGEECPETCEEKDGLPLPLLPAGLAQQNNNDIIASWTPTISGVEFSKALDAGSGAATAGQAAMGSTSETFGHIGSPGNSLMARSPKDSSSAIAATTALAAGPTISSSVRLGTTRGMPPPRVASAASLTERIFHLGTTSSRPIASMDTHSTTRTRALIPRREPGSVVPVRGDESRSSRRDEDCEDNSGSCRNHPGRDCKGSEDCSTFSPSFEDSPIVVCVQPDACRWG